MDPRKQNLSVIIPAAEDELAHTGFFFRFIWADKEIGLR